MHPQILEAVAAMLRMLLVLPIMLASLPALGQGVPVMTDPAAIADCLCRRAHVEIMEHRAAEANRAYEAADARLKALDREVDDTRTRVDPNDEAALDAFRRLLLEAETAKAHLFNETLPHTQGIVAAYNRERADYVPRCTGIAFDPAALARAQSIAACPQPAP